MTFVYILLIAILWMTGWIIRTVNEADRMKIKLFRELLAALNEKVIVLENDFDGVFYWFV